MKGHTDIILTDVRNGHVEHHSDDNMVTNAIKYLYSNKGMWNRFPFGRHTDIDEIPSMPNKSNKEDLVTRLFGGILLFNKSITEDVEQVTVPSGVTMIANGAVGLSSDSNGSVKEVGTYNSTESGWTDDKTFVQTYDWTTSEGNGTIASACLTSQVFGHSGFGNAEDANYGSVDFYTRTNNGHILDFFGSCIPCVAEEVSGFAQKNIGDYLYDFIYSDGEIIIKRYKWNVSSFSFLGQLINGETVKEITLTDAEKGFWDYTNTNSVYTDFYYDYKNKVAYFCRYRHVFNNNYPIYVHRVNMETFEDSPVTITPDAIGVDVHESSTSISYIARNIKAEVLSNKVFIFITPYYDSATHYEYYLINLDNLSDTKAITSTNSQYQSNFSRFNNCVFRDTDTAIFAQFYSSGWTDYGAVLDTQNLTLKRCSNLNSNGYNFGSGWDKNPLVSQPYTVPIATPFYLATINNLSSPVVKDSTRTMKVIYTLTFD